MKDQNRYKNVSIVSETTETIHRSQPVQNKKSRPQTQSLHWPYPVIIYFYSYFTI